MKKLVSETTKYAVVNCVVSTPDAVRLHHLNSNLPVILSVQVCDWPLFSSCISSIFELTFPLIQAMQLCALIRLSV